MTERERLREGEKKYRKMKSVAGVQNKFFRRVLEPKTGNKHKETQIKAEECRDVNVKKMGDRFKKERTSNVLRNDNSNKKRKKGKKEKNRIV